MLHLHRVAPDQEVAEVLNAGHDGLGLALKRAFTPAHQPLVCFQFDEDVGPVRVRSQRHTENFEIGDRQARAQVTERLSPCGLVPGMISVACIYGLEITSARVRYPGTG